LNDGLAGKIALGGHLGPGAVQGGVLVRELRWRRTTQWLRRLS
jgi:hypothetical protein